MFVQKRCSIGKSCGATCIDAQEHCIIEFGPEVAQSLTTVRDFLAKAKEQTVASYEALDTPKKAADWLLKNKEEMASWGFTDEKINDIISKRPAMITFGIEPGVGPAVVKHLEDVKNEVPALSKVLPVRDIKAGANGPWGDQLLKANSYKLAKEASAVLNKLDPQEFPKQLSEAGKQLAAAGMNVDAALKYLYLLGMVKGDKVEGFMDYDKAAQSAAAKDGKILWETAVGLIQQGANLKGGGVYGGNPSGLWKPSQQFGQFKELFEAAGYSPSQAGPFVSNAKWYKYSGQQLGDKVMRLTKEAQPKLMYFGGRESDSLRERLRSEYGQNGTFSLVSRAKNGKEIEKNFEYFLYKQPNGTNTVAMFGPHAGALGFSSNRKLMEAAGEVAQGLINSGTVPRTISSAEVTNVSPIKSAVPNKIPAVGKRVREKQVKQTLAQMTTPAGTKKAGPGKSNQIESVKVLAQQLQRQGYSLARVRDELRKMGVPASLMAEAI